MHVHFRKIARGPAWERWAIIEDQHGDQALAGQAVLTYTDAGSYADVECDIYFARELDETEVQELLDASCAIVTGRGNITVYTTQEVVSRGFSLLDEDEDTGPN